jgi:LacI family transcriptional regulator
MFKRLNKLIVPQLFTINSCPQLLTMKKRTSLKDIAQKVGVSTALVSYVLNNQKEGRISKEVAQKIKAAALELNYRPNQVAKSLKTNKTFTIGLIVADIANPFSSLLARIIEDEAEKINYTVIFGSSDEEAEKSQKLIDVFLNRQVDGLIIALAENTATQLQYLQEQEIPFVLIDRYFPGIKASYVAIDNFQAAASAVRHLIQNNFKRIGLVTFKTSLFHLQERQRGYTATLKEYGLPVKGNWIKQVGILNTQKEIETAIQELLALPEPVEAILFASNILSTQGLKYINTLPIKVPDDLAITSFDESDASYLFYAPITHIRQPLQEMGRQAIRILLENMNNSQSIREINLAAELIVGKSTSRTRS